MIKIGTKKFFQSDQKKFAKLSKDYNKIHISPNESRKMIFGRQIVHGINILLYGLNFFFKNKKKLKINNLDCIFYKPVFLREKIYFFLEKKKNVYIIYIKKKNNILCCIISLNLNNDEKAFFEKKNVFKKNKIKFLRRKKFSINNNYNYLKSKISNNQFQDILSTSYIVGMINPGKYSLFSRLLVNLNLKKNENNKIKFMIKKFDKRINQIEIILDSCINAKIYAFKYNYFEQKSINILKKRIRKKILNNKRTLIIGASRGLGEVTSKLMALLGSKLVLTYNLEKNNIFKIKNEIANSTKVSCTLLKLDILKKDYRSKQKFFDKIHYFFYFASPKITATENNEFNNRIFLDYKNFYLNKFIEFCLFLDKISKEKIKVFYPSTVYINEKNNIFKEYILAKKIAEKKIKLLNKKLKKIKIEIFRLPEMCTSQNMKVLSNKKNINDKIMIKLIRKFI